MQAPGGDLRTRDQEQKHGRKGVVARCTVRTGSRPGCPRRASAVLRPRAPQVLSRGNAALVSPARGAALAARLGPVRRRAAMSLASVQREWEQEERNGKRLLLPL